MSYKITRSPSKNFTPNARVAGFYGQPRKIKAITIHWWGDPKTKPTFAGVVKYLGREGGKSSAHEVIEAGKVALLVEHADAAWHSGSNEGNATTIGLELNPRASGGDYATAAARIRDLREQYGDLPLVPHRSWMATACPGDYDLVRLDRLARQGTPDAPAKPPADNGDKPARLALDGSWGPATTRRLQEVLGTTVDGVLSGQYQGSYNRTVASAKWGTSGSDVVRALQKVLGVTQDGYLGPKTIKALQRRYGTPVDGVISRPSLVVVALQKALNKGKV